MSEQRTKLRYIVKERSLIDNRLVEAGQEVTYDGLPAENLEPTCDEGRARYQEYLDSNAQRVAAMVDQNRPSDAMDPKAFAAAVADAVAQANADADKRQADLLAAIQANQAQVIGAAVATALAQAFPNGVTKKAAEIPANPDPLA